MEPVQKAEFNSAMRHLSDKVIEGNNITKDVLVEQKKTNGRVIALEYKTLRHEELIQALCHPTSPPLTRHDLWLVTWVVSGTASAVVGIVIALVKWLPAMLAAGHLAP